MAEKAALMTPLYLYSGPNTAIASWLKTTILKRRLLVNYHGQELVSLKR